MVIQLCGIVMWYVSPSMEKVIPPDCWTQLVQPKLSPSSAGSNRQQYMTFFCAILPKNGIAFANLKVCIPNSFCAKPGRK